MAKAPKTDNAPPEAPAGADELLTDTAPAEAAPAAPQAAAPGGMAPPALPPVEPGSMLGLIDACNRIWAKHPKQVPGIAGFQSAETRAGRMYDTLENYERRYEEWKKQPA
jgi:hypothetical protein